MITEAQIREARKEDLNSLLFLNQKWQKSVLGENLKDGYIGAAFSEGTFLELINRQQVVIAEAEGKMEGYYLLNDFSMEGVIGKHAEIVQKLKSQNVLNSKLKVIVGAQAVVDKEFMGSGIRKLMLAFLVKIMVGKCDLFFATIAKDNPKAYHAHTKDGWQVIGEEEAFYYVIYNVAQAIEEEK